MFTIPFLVDGMFSSGLTGPRAAARARMGAGERLEK